MRTSRIVRAVYWRHAFGEVLLIVVGILVALAISDWNDRRIERQQELALLGEIRSTLETDVAALETKLDEITAAMVQMDTLFDLLSEPRPYEQEMDRLFGAVYGIRMTNLSSAAYETLKSLGLQTVTDHELRALLARVFDFHYQRFAGAHLIEQEITLNVLRPYYLKHFVDLQFHQSATPIDYQNVVNDPYFRNILHYRIAVLNSNHVVMYPEALTDMKSAISQIDEELGR